MVLRQGCCILICGLFNGKPKKVRKKLNLGNDRLLTVRRCRILLWLTG